MQHRSSMHQARPLEPRARRLERFLASGSSRKRRTPGSYYRLALCLALIQLSRIVLFALQQQLLSMIESNSSRVREVEQLWICCVTIHCFRENATSGEDERRLAARSVMLESTAGFRLLSLSLLFAEPRSSAGR
jgi:hypothetical protein